MYAPETCPNCGRPNVYVTFKTPLVVHPFEGEEQVSEDGVDAYATTTIYNACVVCGHFEHKKTWHKTEQEDDDPEV